MQHDQVSVDEAMTLRDRHIAQLNIELRKILDEEIDAGNEVVETNAGWPTKEGVVVVLKSPFFVQRAKLAEGRSDREVNDPHYWKAEFAHEPSSHILACRFGG